MIEHVRRKFEDKYWAEDGLEEEGVDEFVFRVGGPEDESSGSESSSDSDDSDFDESFPCTFFFIIMSLCFLYNPYLCTSLVFAHT